MKILLMILGLALLGACDSPEEAKKVKENTEISALDMLAEKSLKDAFNDEAYTVLDFYKDGEFSGSYLSNSSINGRDFGQRDLAEETYKSPEIHRSVFSGSFEIKDDLGGGVYELGLSDFSINNEPGPDGEIAYQTWVDFAQGLAEDDEYYLYLSGADLPAELIANNQYDLSGGPYQAFGPVLYNKSQKLVFTSHDMWAMDHDHSHEGHDHNHEDHDHEHGEEGLGHNHDHENGPDHEEDHNH